MNEALLTKLAALFAGRLRAALRKAGECIDIVVTGDAVADPSGPMMSPDM